MTIHLDTFPFTDADPVNGLSIPPNDQTRLQFLGGGVPFAGIVWGGFGSTGPDSLRTWRWIHDHGYTQCLGRLYYGQGALPGDPAGYIDSMVGPFQELETALIVATAQLLNEWNNEYGSYPLPSLVAWGTRAINRWRVRLPTKRIYMSAPAQDNKFLEYVAGLDPLFRLADGIALHFYFGRHAGDMKPGFEGSPEWWHARYPSKRLWVSECANWTNRDDVRSVYSRWTTYPWLDGFADWKASGPNDAEFNWTDDHVNVLAEVNKTWRALRAFPEGVAAPPPITGVDLHQLREDMSAQDALARATRGYANEMVDRVKSVWDRYGLGGLK